MGGRWFGTKHTSSVDEREIYAGLARDIFWPMATVFKWSLFLYNLISQIEVIFIYW